MNCNRQSKLRVVMAATLLALAFAVPGWAQIYFQNPDYNGAFSSQDDTNGYETFVTAYDNFTIGTGYNLSGEEWVGSYFYPSAQLGSNSPLALFETPVSTPSEPGTLLLLGSGLLGLAATIRRKTTKR